MVCPLLLPVPYCCPVVECGVVGDFAVLLAKIDIHAAFWQLSVPKIVTLGCGFMHDASL